ncbi:MAG: FxLYD domain-containing protein [Dehalococcoidia bacterium]
MKKLAVLVFVLAGLSAFAATCVIRNVGETEIDGDLVYGAEMRNETTLNMLNHRFLVGFIDDDGEVINTKNATQCSRTMQANASNYYSADSGVDPDDVDVVLSRMIIDSGLKLGIALASDLEISNVVAVRDGDDVRVTGTVKNDGNDDYEDVIVCIVIFNDQDDVVIVVLEDEFDLDSDDSQSFSVTVGVTDDDDDSDRVLVVADAVNADENDQFTKPVSQAEDVDACTANTATPTGTSTATATATNTSTPVTATATKTPNPAAC